MNAPEKHEGLDNAVAQEEDIRSLVARIVDEVLPATEGSAAPAVVGDKAAAAGAATEGAIAIGADHGGYALKETLAAHLRELGHGVQDCGCFSSAAVDYPDIAHEVASRVANGACRWGIMVDGAGIGSAMVANKIPGIRAALCYDLSSARNSREHNHANVLTLGAGLIGVSLARQIVSTWLETPWGGGRHGKRVDKITAVEKAYAK
jgi:ribose 5-phosphate isomerase B